MLALACASLLLSAAAEKPHAYGIVDQLALRRLTSFEVSPDGTRVAYALRSTDMEANKGRVDLWVVGTDGQGNRQLTSHPDSESEPQWAPDGKSLYFLSGRSGTSQVYRLSLEGGEPVAVTQGASDVETFRLSPDGKTLVFGAETYPDCPDLECTEKRVADKAKSKVTGMVYDKLFVRHWDSWKTGRRSHLFAVSVEGGKRVDLMAKMDADCPTKPFGGIEDFAFTPDGKGVVFSARNVGREEAWSTDFDLFHASLDGKSAPKKLTTANRALDGHPVFSPDGKTLAYVAMKRAGYEADRQTLVLRNWADGKERFLGDGWDYSVDGFAWAADSKSLAVIVGDKGQKSLWSLDVAGTEPKSLVKMGNVTAVQSAGTSWVYGLDTLSAPVDLWRLGSDGNESQAITQVNKELLSKVKFGESEQFTFAGWNRETVHAYVVKPVDFDAKKKYPLAFLIHGGPQGSFGNHFHYRWNPQVYAGRGYVAVMVDFHGSTGYGQAFTDSIRGDWGGKPLEDLQKGLASALARYPFIDKARACALGASYGGYMVNWIAGLWNEPFKCLVNHDGNLDERMAYYDTEELWFPEWEHGGVPWEQDVGFTKHNPIDHVGKWKTPMLVVHGGKDYRVVDTQGISTFTALQRRGIPSKFLYFPDENHWVLKPQNSLLWHETVLGWLDQWTKAK